MTGYNSSLQNLTEQFRKLQGIGAKTAQRLAYYVLSMPPEDVEVQGEWRENDNGRWYRYPDGSYPKNTWVSIFGEKYFFDEKGYMVTGWVTWKDKEYYCGDDGVMLVNTVTPDGERVGPDGSRQ